jgi:hypothetical protein
VIHSAQDSEICTLLDMIDERPIAGEAPPFAASLASTQLANLRLYCGMSVYNPRQTTGEVEIVQSVTFSADRAYALIFVDYGFVSGPERVRLLGGHRYIAHRTDTGWQLVRREDEWEY